MSQDLLLALKVLGFGDLQPVDRLDQVHVPDGVSQQREFGRRIFFILAGKLFPQLAQSFDEQIFPAYVQLLSRVARLGGWGETKAQDLRDALGESITKWASTWNLRDPWVTDFFWARLCELPLVPLTQEQCQAELARWRKQLDGRWRQGYWDADGEWHAGPITTSSPPEIPPGPEDVTFDDPVWSGEFLLGSLQYSWANQDELDVGYPTWPELAWSPSRETWEAYEECIRAIIDQAIEDYKARVEAKLKDHGWVRTVTLRDSKAGEDALRAFEWLARFQIGEENQATIAKTEGLVHSTIRGRIRDTARLIRLTKRTAR